MSPNSHKVRKRTTWIVVLVADCAQPRRPSQHFSPDRVSHVRANNNRSVVRVGVTYSLVRLVVSILKKQKS